MARIRITWEITPISRADLHQILDPYLGPPTTLSSSVSKLTVLSASRWLLSDLSRGPKTIEGIRVQPKRTTAEEVDVQRSPNISSVFIYFHIVVS